jgi:hypothetical protein
MPGTILIVILLLAPIGALPRGHIAEVGNIVRAKKLDLFFLSLLFSWFLAGSEVERRA